MKSKKPFFSRELIYNNLRRFWWVAVLYTLALFLVSPLITLTNGSDTVPKSGYNIIFSDIFDGSIIFLFTVPVFIGVMVFRYMQNPKSTVMLHSMPYTRLRLYINNLISGLILLIVPILLNTAFLSVIELGSFGGTYFKEGIVLRYLWVSLLTSVTLYMWTVFVGMFTGSSIAQIIFTYILNFLLVGLVAVTQYLLGGILYGFVMNEEICIKFLQISPIAQIMFLSGNSSDAEIGFFLIADFVTVIGAVVAGYFAYKYRNLETAGDVISGRYIKPIFKYGVTVCVMLVGALYVGELFSLEPVSIFVYLLFALIGYIVAEMLLRKSFRIWDSYKGFLIFALIFSVVFFGTKADMFGYEKYIPDLRDVKSAALNGYAEFLNSTPENPGYGVLYQKENIENIIKLHEAAVEDKNINLTSEARYEDSISISYELIDGRIVKRAYDFENGKYDEALKTIYDSEEYIRATNSLFDYTPDDIYGMRISNALTYDTMYVSIGDKAEIKELFEAMQKDIITTGSDEKEEFRNIYRIELTLKPEEDADTKVTRPEMYSIKESVDVTAEFISFVFNKNAENVNAFIKEKGYESVVKNTEAITGITLCCNDEEDTKKVVTSKDKIEEIMNFLYETSGNNYRSRYENRYSVRISTSDNMYWIDIIEEDSERIINLFE